MKTNEICGIPSQALPRGRFLYRESDDGRRFALHGRRDDPRLWITGRALAAPGRATGPFERHDAVRALRLANLEIPDGCELGPWQDGLGFFSIAPLPGDVGEWEVVEPARLEPSVSLYGAEDITDEPVRQCCAPPAYPPSIRWGKDAKVDSKAPMLEPIFRRYPMLSGVRIGALSKMWNGHPARSLVWAPLGGALHRGFYISDFE